MKKIPKLSYRQILLSTLFIILQCCLKQGFGLVGTLNQIEPTYLQLTTDKDMIIDSSLQLKTILTITVGDLSTSSYSYNFIILDKKTIEIYMQYTESFIYQDLTLTINKPEAIKDSSGVTLDKTSYKSEIQSIFVFTDAEQTIQDIIPYIVWGFFGVFILCIISLLITKIDTVGIWIILDFFQICGIFNFLSIVKAKPLMLYLSEMNKCNFFFIPTWFYQLLTVITDTLSTTSSSVFIKNKDIDSPSSTSFIRTTGNAIVIVFLYSILTLGFSFSACLKLQAFFNHRSLYRLLDILLIHFVFASVINLRFYSFDSGYAISDFVLSIITLIAYFFYSTIIPCLKVNNSDIIMLEKNAIEKYKHFINKVRVEFFFSRNFFFFRTIFKILLSVGIALGTLNTTATGIIQFLVVAYFITIFTLNLRYSLYDDERLNTIQIISTVFLFFLILLFIILWSFEQFYRMVSRKSSSQIDSSYITINHYLSWTLICLLTIAKVCFIICLLSYLYSTRKNKIEFLLKRSKSQLSPTKTQNNLQEDLINENNSQNMTFQDNQMAKNSQLRNGDTSRDIEMTRQPKQYQNSYDISTMQSQLFESPQKLINPNSKMPNSSGFQVNIDSVLNSQPQQRQFLAQPSPNQTSNIQPSDFNSSLTINANKAENQQDQEQEINNRFLVKTSTFSADENNKNQA